MFLKSLLGNEDHMEDDRLGKVLTSARGRRKKEDVADFWQQVSAFKEGDEVEMRNYDYEEWSYGKVAKITEETNVSIFRFTVRSLNRDTNKELDHVDYYYQVRLQGTTSPITVDECDLMNATPLFHASKRGNFGCAQFLL